MVRARECGDHLRRLGDPAGELGEALELADEHVAVPLDALEAAADEDERLAADDRPVPLVDLLRDDEVHLAMLVLEQHEHDPLRGGGTLARDRHAGERDRRPVPRLVQLGARERPRG